MQANLAAKFRSGEFRPEILLENAGNRA